VCELTSGGLAWKFGAEHGAVRRGSRTSTVIECAARGKRRRGTPICRGTPCASRSSACIAVIVGPIRSNTTSE
jgi:hypothetical protein